MCPGKIFHSNTTSSQVTLSSSRKRGVETKYPTFSAHAFADRGYSGNLLPRHGTESEKTDTFAFKRLTILSCTIVHDRHGLRPQSILFVIPNTCSFSRLWIQCRVMENICFVEVHRSPQTRTQTSSFLTIREGCCRPNFCWWLAREVLPQVSPCFRPCPDLPGTLEKLALCSHSNPLQQVSPCL